MNFELELTRSTYRIRTRSNEVPYIIRDFLVFYFTQKSLL